MWCAGEGCRAALRSGCLAMIACAGIAVGADNDADALLQRGERAMTVDHEQFVAIVQRLDARRDSLDRVQRALLRYLDARDQPSPDRYDAAAGELRAVLAVTDDATLRLRIEVALTDVLARTAHYDDAYSHLDALLALQPRLAAARDRVAGYRLAALLYVQAGQYDLAIENADRWRAAAGDAAAACEAGYLEAEALYRAGTLAGRLAASRAALAACIAIADPVHADLIRELQARLAADDGHPDAAIASLGERYAEIRQTHQPPLASAVDATLARAWFARGDMPRARRFAQSAVADDASGPTSRARVDAFELLYRIARGAGDAEDALAWLERYAAAEKARLADSAARALASQGVRQHALDRKRELAEREAKNLMLHLNSEVHAKSAETQRLYLLLLLLVLAFIALWGIRIKRSQKRFQILARRDGLTGIVNRQHFMDEAHGLLRLGAKTRREISLILIDLDHFKRVNDTRGHAAGDAVLRRTVAMCQLHMRSDDLFGRLGGEEFGVMLPDCGLDTAQARAEELRGAIAALAGFDGGPFVSASFGVTSTRKSGYDLHQMLIDSDSALYRAKREGRNRVAAFVGMPHLQNA